MIDEREDWRASALCRKHPEINFFPAKGDIGSRAKNLCAVCPVRQPCLDYSLQRVEIGIWAGTAERERRKIRLGRIPKPSWAA